MALRLYQQTVTPRGKSGLMETQCTTEQTEFQQLERRPVIGRFDSGRISSDAGGLLLREVEGRFQMLKRLAARGESRARAASHIPTCRLGGLYPQPVTQNVPSRNPNPLLRETVSCPYNSGNAFLHNPSTQKSLRTVSIFASCTSRGEQTLLPT